MVDSGAIQRHTSTRKYLPQTTNELAALIVAAGGVHDFMVAKIPTIELKGRKWKVWVVDETDVTITVRVRPLRTMTPAEFTIPFRAEFNVFDNLAAEAVERYLGHAPAPRARAAHSS